MPLLLALRTVRLVSEPGLPAGSLASLAAALSATLDSIPGGNGAPLGPLGQLRQLGGGGGGGGGAQVVPWMCGDGVSGQACGRGVRFVWGPDDGAAAAAVAALPPLPPLLAASARDVARQRQLDAAGEHPAKAAVSALTQWGLALGRHAAVQAGQAAAQAGQAARDASQQLRQQQSGVPAAAFPPIPLALAAEEQPADDSGRGDGMRASVPIPAGGMAAAARDAEGSAAEPAGGSGGADDMEAPLRRLRAAAAAVAAAPLLRLKAVAVAFARAPLRLIAGDPSADSPALSRPRPHAVIVLTPLDVSSAQQQRGQYAYRPPPRQPLPVSDAPPGVSVIYAFLPSEPRADPREALLAATEARRNLPPHAAAVLLHTSPAPAAPAGGSQGPAASQAARPAHAGAGDSASPPGVDGADESTEASAADTPAEPIGPLQRAMRPSRALLASIAARRRDLMGGLRGGSSSAASGQGGAAYSLAIEEAFGAWGVAGVGADPAGVESLRAALKRVLLRNEARPRLAPGQKAPLAPPHPQQRTDCSHTFADLKVKALRTNSQVFPIFWQDAALHELAQSVEERPWHEIGWRLQVW